MKIPMQKVVGIDIASFLFILVNRTKLPMKQDLAQKAVSVAISGKWEEALKLNKEILKTNPKDVDAHNRLARAFAELGNLPKAKSTANKVLKIDPFNSIAIKSLEKWKDLKAGETYKSGPSSPQAFLEEPGKTKIVSLIHLGDQKVLAKLDSGDEIRLNTRSHRISVSSTDGKYIGRLPDDLSARLRKLIKYGNEYQSYIKSADSKEVKLFIRETKRAEELSDIPSFSSEKIDYISFTPPELVHKKETFEDEVEDEE